VKGGERIIRPTKFPGLSVLPAGSPPDNPSELLASSRFRTLLASLAEHFDWIVIDSPPIMAVADAAIVADEVSSVLFVVAADLTREDAARVALNELAAARSKILGAVLNRVDFDGQRYYYSRYYRPEYEAYYINKATDEFTTPA
jgi:capsular exopolysaccharide synthesis family protein